MSSSAWAGEHPLGFYGGVSTGVTSFSGAPVVSQSGSTSSNFGSEKGNTLFAGYFLDTQLAFETSLFYFDQTNSNISGPGGNQQVSLGVYGITADALRYVSFSDSFS